MSVSTRHKFRGALKGKEKFITQIQQFGTLIQRLHSLVPLYSVGAESDRNGFSKGESPTRPTVEANLPILDEYNLNFAHFRESQRVLDEMMKQVKSTAATTSFTEYTKRQKVKKGKQ